MKQNNWREKLANMAEKYCPDHGTEPDRECLYHIFEPFIESIEREADYMGYGRGLDAAKVIVRENVKESLESFRAEIEKKRVTMSIFGEKDDVNTGIVMCFGIVDDLLNTKLLEIRGEKN